MLPPPARTYDTKYQIPGTRNQKNANLHENSKDSWPSPNPKVPSLPPWGHSQACSGQALPNGPTAKLRTTEANRRWHCAGKHCGTISLWIRLKKSQYNRQNSQTHFCSNTISDKHLVPSTSDLKKLCQAPFLLKHCENAPWFFSLFWQRSCLKEKPCAFAAADSAKRHTQTRLIIIEVDLLASDISSLLHSHSQ